MARIFLNSVEEAAKACGEVPVPREFIRKALGKLQQGKARIESCPSRKSSLKAVFDIAVQLHAETMLKH